MAHNGYSTLTKVTALIKIYTSLLQADHSEFISLTHFLNKVLYTPVQLSLEVNQMKFS